MWFLDGRAVSDVIAAGQRKRRVIPLAAWLELDVPELVDPASLPDVDITTHQLPRPEPRPES